jgi:carboxymethylenebutenolidase
MGYLKEGPELDVTVVERTLTVDGYDVPIVHARPDGMPKAGVVLHPDLGGLRPLFHDMARRLATHGFAVCAFEQFATRPESELGSIESRIWQVKELDDVTRVSALGFCMGGHYVFKAAASDRFDAAVAFYGMLRTPDDWRGPGHTIEPLDVAAQMCPTLAIFGSIDQWTPAADIDALRAAWQGRSDCEIVMIEGADHGFVHDPERDVHRAEDAAACWARAIDWMS